MFWYQSTTPEDVVREGFPEWSPEQFVEMMVAYYGVVPDTKINCIEFDYIGDSL